MIRSIAPQVRLCSVTPTTALLHSLVSDTKLSSPHLQPLPLTALAKLPPSYHRPSNSSPLVRWTHTSAPSFSGHNRWSKIKHKKEAADQEKSMAIARYGKRIRSAIQITGTTDPENNFKLASLINQAKAAGMSKSQIDSILKADPKKSPSDHVLYEARAQAGYLILMDVMTSNKTRCRQDLRLILVKNGAVVGETGSSLFNFIHKGIVQVPCHELLSSGTDADELGIEVGAEEVVLDDSGSIPNPDEDVPSLQSEESADDKKCYQFVCDPRDLWAVAGAIKDKSFTVSSAILDYTPKSLVKLGQKDFNEAEKLMGLLEAYDEVIDVYDNFVLDEQDE